jgi:hypothetical protein
VEACRRRLYIEGIGMGGGEGVMRFEVSSELICHR